MTGITTKMITTAPHGAYYVCSTALEAHAMAQRGKELDRADLQFRDVGILTTKYLKAKPAEVVVDSGVKLNPTQYEVLRKHRLFMNTFVPPKETTS